jgi:hypothetical protein
MFWLYLSVVIIIVCGAAVVIDRRRRRGISYDHESTARLARAQGESKFPAG